jgi:hypothetical protein
MVSLQFLAAQGGKTQAICREFVSVSLSTHRSQRQRNHATFCLIIRQESDGIRVFAGAGFSGDGFAFRQCRFAGVSNAGKPQPGKIPLRFMPKINIV